MKPSIFKQVAAVPVTGRELKESPRHWNCGLLRYKDKLWMSYRYHLKNAGGRCATAIVELSPTTYQPISVSQHLALSGPTGDEHHEDARLFIFRGEPHISFTEMRGYKPGVDYTCVIRYAKLKLRGNRWIVVDVFQPRWASNDGRGKEKNWVFFEHEGILHAVYSGGPNQIVLSLDGERIVDTYTQPGAVWSWGTVRGGTTPIMQPDGTFLTIFHSSLPTEMPPHFVRYYAGAYTFSAKPPFTPIRVSMKPLMAGSEEDGHQVDPRYVAGWKPYVVFPCGIVSDGDRYLISIGVNDWQCAIAQMRSDQFHLMAADGSEKPVRYFRRENGSVPVRILGLDMRTRYLPWNRPRASGVVAGAGFMACDDARDAQEVSEHPGVEEITSGEYEVQNRTAHTFR